MIQIADKQYDLLIERKRIKNIYLKVVDNTIVVTCPYYVTKNDILSFINEKRKWIYNYSNKKVLDSKLTFGEYIYYRGIKYRLVILNGNKSIKIDGDTLAIRCRGAEINKAIRAFYELGKKDILDVVHEKQDKYLNILKDYGYDSVPIYNVKYLKSMWGCCYNKKNLINLSARLIHFDDKTIEAILWHELLHFIIPNHSKRYHQVLETYMPEYKQLVSKMH